MGERKNIFPKLYRKYLKVIKIFLFNSLSSYIDHKCPIFQLAGAVEYTDCTSAEG